MNTEWMECVRWCHSAEDRESVDALIQALYQLQSRSSYADPILTMFREESGVRAAGYLVLYEGALASVGNLRVESFQNDDRELHHVLLTDLAKELLKQAFDQGAEIIQAISPLASSQGLNEWGPVFDSPDPKRDQVLNSAGLLPVAKLVQMDCSTIQPYETFLTPVACDGEHDETCFFPFTVISSTQWSQLVENTYLDTRDVPELNGLRRVESTLAGYASTWSGIPETWWLMRCKGVDIGCLLITPTSVHCCELTYIGLVPEWRGKGFSKVMMNFVRDWALKSKIERITLAVDLRNAPAIRLYQSCGFIAERFVQAWICLSPPD